MREAPAKAAIDREFRSQGLEVIGVNLGEDRETVRKFAGETGIQFLLLLDRDGQIPRLFGLWAHPNTVLIDRAGRVIGLVRGERDWQSEAARRLVQQLLEKDR
ncbi:MAG: TlpA family protein disulfide reductase [Candidatus Rokubacteria bacterium]|nr:TlpA family protein disulfide reductase [Candidatus Rokubacteria bacterium]